jgi:hypothetical protein
MVGRGVSPSREHEKENETRAKLFTGNTPRSRSGPFILKTMLHGMTEHAPSRMGGEAPSEP